MILVLIGQRNELFSAIRAIFYRCRFAHDTSFGKKVCTLNKNCQANGGRATHVERFRPIGNSVR